MAISPVIIMIAIICAGMAVLYRTKDREINNLIRGFEVWLLQILLFIGLYLLEKDCVTTQTVKLMLIMSAAVTLSSGIVLARRSCEE